MSNNLHKVQNIFISDGAALPADDAAITALTAGQIGIYGTDMKALNPAGGDTMSTQPAIYIVESKTDSNGINYVKRSTKIDGASVIKYEGKSYEAAKREVWAIGYNRATAAGSIEVNNDTEYQFSIVFKNYKWLYSERQETLRVNFTSALAATQLSIATQVANAINNSAYKTQIKAVVVTDGAGNYGVEIWALDVPQNLNTTYTLNQVYFQVAVNDATGFGTSTTCAQIQAFDSGNGTYNQVYNMENYDFQYEGVLNRIAWPIPVLDYSASSAMISSAAVVETVNITTGSDSVTFSNATIATKLKAGDKVSLDGVVYEIKYFVSTTVAILTTNATSTNAAGAVLLRVKYDLVTIEYNDAINTPTGVVAVANKSVVIAVPALDAGDAYNGVSAAGQDVMDILNAWMASTPRAFANISI
jgi:hypothetical protein